MDVIKSGTLLIENGTLLPRSLVLASEPYSSGWTTVANLRSDFERDITQAGWTFFFLAGEIHPTVFGFNPGTDVHTAGGLYLPNAETQDCKRIEISEPPLNAYPGLPIACVPAHSRDIHDRPAF